MKLASSGNEYVTRRNLTMLILAFAILAAPMLVYSVKNVHASGITGCDEPAFTFITPTSPVTVTTAAGTTADVSISVQLNALCFDGSVAFTPSLFTPAGLTCANLPTTLFVSEADQFPIETVVGSCSADSPNDYSFTITVNATTTGIFGPCGSNCTASPCSSPDILLPSGECEELQTSPSITFQVTKASPTITTAILPSAIVTVGDTVTDQAQLQGGALSTGAGGSVSYTFFASNNCANVGLSDGSPPIGPGNSISSSNPVTPTSPGEFSFQAVYSGDANNNGATSPCELLTVNPATPTVVTSINPTSTVSAGTLVTDQATISGGYPSSGVGGFVTYFFYLNSNCAGPGVSVGMVRVGPGNQVLPSNSIPTGQVGVFSVSASYSGDGSNSPVPSACEALTVIKASPTLATSVSPSCGPGWCSTTPYPASPPELPSSCVESQGYVYCVGSTNFSPPTNHVFFAPLSPDGIGSWSTTTPYPIIINGVSCAEESGFIYCVGGAISGSLPEDAVNNVYYAQLSSNGVGPWLSTTPYPEGHLQQSCVTSSGYIYCIGSWNNTQVCLCLDYNGNDYFAPISPQGVGAWTKTTPYPTTIIVQSCVASSNVVYCIGGDAGTFANPNLETNAVYYAQLSSNGIGSWTSTTGYPSGSAGIAFESCLVNSGNIYCISGFTNTAPLQNVYIAPIFANGIGTWSSGIDYPSGIFETTCVTYSVFIYCIGGQAPPPTTGFSGPTDADYYMVISTTSFPLGTTVVDNAVLSGASPSTGAGGSVSYYFYNNGACSGAGVSEGTQPLGASNVAGPSNPVTPGPPGSYSFQAVYSGDGNNMGATSNCEIFTVTKAPTIITTTMYTATGSVILPGSSVFAGTSVTDYALIAPGVPLFGHTGSLTLNYYANGACSGSPLTSVESSSVGGGIVSEAGLGPITPTPGSYSFSASYSGDPDYLASVSSCEPLNVFPVPSLTGIAGVGVETDSGVIIMTLTDSSGNVVGEIILPPGTSLSGTWSLTYSSSIVNGVTNNVIQVTGATVPYPSLCGMSPPPPVLQCGKSILVPSGGNSQICIVDAPSGATLSTPPGCTATNPSQYQVLLTCNGTPSGPYALPDGNRVYTCTQVVVNSINYLRIDGLAHSFVETIVHDSSSTIVNCSAASVLVNAAVTCTATVTDTSAGGAVAPGSTVSFSSSGAGSFVPMATCTLQATPAVAASSCSVTYTPNIGSQGDHTISVVYDGDLNHFGSNGAATLGVFDFAVSVTVDQTVLRGGSASYIVTLSLLSGSTGAPSTIPITISGLPSDVTTPGFSSFIALPGTNMLSVQTGPNSLGDFSFTISGSPSTGGSRSSTASLHIYDFAIVSPSTVTIARGQRVCYVVNAVLSSGSSTFQLPSIQLSVSTLPTNSPMFTPNPVTTGFDGHALGSCLLLDTSANTSLGDFPFTVVGSDNRGPSGGSRTGGGTLHIFDFTVNVIPSQGNVILGGSVSYTVSVSMAPGSSLVGLPNDVTLTLTGLPLDASALFRPVSVLIPAGGVSTLTVNTGPKSLGRFALGITGTSASSAPLDYQLRTSRTASASLLILPPIVTITANTVLASDATEQVLIGADKITLNCNGHAISGVSTDNTGSVSNIGIALNGRTGVRIVNCYVTRFYTGIQLVSSNANLLARDNATGDGYGFSLLASNMNALLGNKAVNNVIDGFRFDGSNSNVLTADSAVNNLGNGFTLYRTVTNAISFSNSTSNGVDGFFLQSTNGTLLLSNNALHNSGSGIQLVASSRNTIRSNNASNNNVYGFAFTASSSQNQVVLNNACMNGVVDGFQDTTSTGNVFNRNNFCTTKGI